MLGGEVIVLSEAALRFPTVIFTIGLGIILIYWLFVILGALDIDLFGDADVAGASKGIGDAIIGAKGGGEAIGDAIAGGAKGGAQGIGDAIAGAKGVKPDIGHHETGGIFSGLGLSKVPITISMSAIFLVCWCISLVAMHYAPDVLGTKGWVAAVILPLTLILGLPLAGLLVRPLGRVFELKEGLHNRDCIGMTCTITTGSVNDGFGQATIEDGGTVLVIPVRCDRPDVLSRGQKALVIDFDNAREAFVVEPAADMLPDVRAEGSDSNQPT